MLCATEETPMSETATLERLDHLTRLFEQLASRVEDLEDNRDLEQAIAENDDKPLVPWENAKALLGLD